MVAAPRDYSKEDYAPRDHHTIDAVYDTQNRTFIFRPRSQLSKYIRRGTLKPIPVPRFRQEITFSATWRADPSQMILFDETVTRTIAVPGKIWVGRNVLGRFREIYLLKPGHKIA
ncbi:hypothetical protein DL98DRAFT_642676 [Cadophora sp. DSE1049]|nr:hypothetical protein DL98DRAFT_642676 [Cadophora sp. DSE1049]